MFFSKSQYKIIEQNHLWYIETNSGFEGPFESQSEAKEYLHLHKKTDMARIELASLEESAFKF